MAPETYADHAEWLRTRAAFDPAAVPLAFAVFDQVFALSPHDIQSRDRLAQLQAATGDTDGALAGWRSILAADPLYGPAYLHLADLQWQLGDVEAAQSYAGHRQRAGVLVGRIISGLTSRRTGPAATLRVLRS